MVIYNYIAVEGVIGAGKTTLAQALAQKFKGEFVPEKFEENPFLPDFYKNPEHNAFATQIFFLLARYRQLAQLHSYDLFHEVVVADYLFEKDKIFAYLNLSEAELRLYEEIEKHLESELPKPNLVIYLQATTPTLMDRIKNRGRAYEKRITENYIDRLVEAYNYFFFGYRESPLLVVNTENLDLTQAPAVETLIERVKKPVIGTEYYNPSKTFWG